MKDTYMYVHITKRIKLDIRRYFEESDSSLTKLSVKKWKAQVHKIGWKKEHVREEKDIF